MTNEKRPKPKIKRRPPGLVITPPVPRPVGEDHPARLLFREAIESSKETAVELAAVDVQEAVGTSEHMERAEPTSLSQAPVEPLQIFKELREATAAPDEFAPVNEQETDPSPEVVVSQDRKSTRLNSSHTEIYTLSLHDALPISFTDI